MLLLPKFIGHRGVRGLAPENTLASFKAAKAFGFTWVEFDVMLAACGEAVVFHDHQLKRTTNGSGLIARKTYDELRKLDAGNWFSSAFQHEPIPTLAETLKCLIELDLHPNIEIKPTRGMDIATAQKTMAIVQAIWPADLAKPLISSFSLPSLYTVQQIDNGFPLGLLYKKLPRYWLKAADELNCQSIHLNQQFLTVAQINEIKQTGRQVLAYTVNTSERAELLLSWGVDAVFTDYPLHHIF